MLDIKVICEHNGISKELADEIKESFIEKNGSYSIEKITGINKKGDIIFVKLKDRKTSYNIVRFTSKHPSRTLQEELNREVTIGDIDLKYSKHK